MAISPTYEHSSVSLKKLTLTPLGETYWLKDADLRAVVEGFGSAVYKDVVTTFDATGVDIATEAATAAYIQDQVAGITGAMHFRGIVTKGEQQTHLQAIAAYYSTTLSDTPKAGDVVIFRADGKEFICCAEGTTEPQADPVWEEVGDQNIYLTIASAASTYVPQTRTIAGIGLNADISVADLEAASALNLKALAHKDSASGSVEVLDTIASISSGKAGAYNVTDQSTVSVPQTFNALDVTPAGSVSISAGTAAAASYDKTTSVSVSASASDNEHAANYTPSGSVSISAGTAAAASYDKTTAVAITASTPDANNAANYTPAGSVSISADTAAAVSYDKTSSVSISSTAPDAQHAANYTPSGSVSISADTAAAASYDKTTSVTINSSTPDAQHTANYTPSGSITLPTLSASVSLDSTSAATVTDNGTAYQLSGGSVSQASDTTGKFIKKGVSFEVDAQNEVLNLAYVTDTTNTTFFDDAVTAAGAVTYSSPTLTGSLPTFGSVSVAAPTGATASASYDGSATFSGDGTVLGTSVSHTSTAASMTQPTFTGSFSGDGTVLGTSVTHASTAATVTQPTFTGSFSGTGTVLGTSVTHTSTAASMTQPTFTASFNGDGAVISATPSHTATDATVTQPTFTASFSGTENSVTPTAATTANAAAVGGKVTVDSETIAITPTKKTVTVTVS